MTHNDNDIDIDNEAQQSAAQRSAAEFTMVAGQYCRLMENLAPVPPRALARFLARLLPMVYYTAWALPQAGDYDRDNLERFVTEEEWNAVQQQLAAKFGHHDPLPAPAAIPGRHSHGRDTGHVHTCGCGCGHGHDIDTDNNDGDGYTPPESVSECLADLYQSLADYTRLVAYGLDDAARDATAEIKRTFAEYWGQNATRALDALHRMAVSDCLPAENPTPARDTDTDD